MPGRYLLIDLPFWDETEFLGALGGSEQVVDAKNAQVTVTIGSAAIREKSKLKAVRMEILEHLLHSWKERTSPRMQTLIHVIRDHLRGSAPCCLIDAWNEGGPHIFDLPPEPATDLFIAQLLRFDNTLVHEPRIRFAERRAIELHAVMKRSIIIEEYCPFAHTVPLNQLSHVIDNDTKSP